MLATEGYKAELAEKHRSSPTWGSTASRYAPQVTQIINDYRPGDVLDYGCGKQSLARALSPLRIRGYDPGLPGLDAPPEPADLVVCIDVLEHIEPDCIYDVLDDLQRVTRKVGYFVVDTHPAIHTLPDGRNAHLIVEPLEWWLRKLMNRFKLAQLHNGPNDLGFAVLVRAKKPEGNGNA